METLTKPLETLTKPLETGINKFAEAAAGVQGVQSSASKIRKLTPAPPSNEASKPPPPHATYAVGENPELNTVSFCFCVCVI